MSEIDLGELLDHIDEKAEDFNTYNEARDEYIARMEAEGFEVRYPAQNELQIDMDSETHFETFQSQLQVLLRDYPSASYTIWPSRNGLPGRHASVLLPFPVSDEARIALQASLGSDPLRELLSMFRLLKGDKYPTLFVENKAQVLD